MPSAVTCHCGRKFEVEQTGSDRRVNCPTCNSVIFLSAPAEKDDSGDGFAIAAEPEEDVPFKPKGRLGDPDWLQRYRASKETVRGEHSHAFTTIAALSGGNATLDPLGAALYLAVTHADAETSVAALAKVAITPHKTYTAIARAMLAHVGPTDATGAQQLIELLHETTDESACLLLIETLERIGPTAIVHVKFLIEQLSSPHERMKRWVVRSLAKVGKPARHAVDPLLKSLKGATPELKLLILDALASIGREPDRIVPLLQQALHHPAAEFRQHGVRGLQRLGAAAAAAASDLKACVSKETDPGVKQAAVEALTAIVAAVKRGGASAPQAPSGTLGDDGLLHVHCPCGKHLKAKPELAGRKVKCPGCGQPIALPALPSASTAADLKAAPPAADSEKDCPRCLATVPAAMVLCVSCGFDFRTGKTVKKAAKPEEKKAKPVTPPVREELVPAKKKSRAVDSELRIPVAEEVVPSEKKPLR